MSKFSRKIGNKQFLAKRLAVVMIVLIAAVAALSIPLADGTRGDKAGNIILNSGGRIVNQTRLDDERGLTLSCPPNG
jgi:hypothetical protein